MQVDLLRAMRARLLACASILMLIACGGGGGGGGSSSGGGGNSAPTVAAISFHPITFDVAPGGKLYFRADAAMSDGSTFEITTMASWTSSAPAIATVGSSTGILDGVAEGSTDVTVTYRGTSAVAHVRVGTYLQSIEVITAQRLGLGVGATFQFTATGQYTNGARDVTQVADWSSSNSSVLKISNATDSKGFATALTPGQVTVTSASEGTRTDTVVEVLPIQSLAEYRDISTCNPRLGGLSVDAAGRALSMWSCPFAGVGAIDLWWSSTPTGSSNWAAATPLRTLTQRALAQTIKTATNDDGMVVAAWGQLDGIYVALYKPSTGWQAPKQIAPQSPQSPNEPIFVGIDGEGNALVAWWGSAMQSSSYNRSTDRWSAPAVVPLLGADTCMVNVVSFEMSALGHVSMVWSSINCYSQPGETPPQGIYAARWQAATGWQAPEQVAPNPSNLISAVIAAANEADGIAVAWIDYPPASEPNANPLLSPQRIFSRSFAPGSGWGATFPVASELKRQPRLPKMGMNIHGGAVLSWENGYDYSVSAALFDPIKGWSSPTDLSETGDLMDFGDATPMTPYLLDDGRALVTWRAPFIGLGQFALSRFTPGTGWVYERLVYVGRRNIVQDIDIRFNRKGQGAIAWIEGPSPVTNFYVKAGLSF